MSDYSKTDIGSGYNSTTSINTELGKIETAVNSKVDKSGSTMTGNMDMNSNRVLNLPAPAAGTEPVRLTDLPASAESTTASLVTYNQGGTGATDTTVQSKLQETVSVKDFGAVGDGVTDDTLAVQAALDSGATNILFPSGKTYLFTNQLNPPTGANIFAYGAILKWTSFGTTLASTVAEKAATGNAIRLQSNSTWFGGNIILDGVASPSGISIPAGEFSGAFWNIFAVGHFNTVTTSSPSTLTDNVIVKDVDAYLASGSRFGFSLVAGYTSNVDFINCTDDTTTNASDILIGIEATWGAGTGNETFHPFNIHIENYTVKGAPLNDMEGVRFAGAYDSGCTGFKGSNLKKGITFYIGDPGTNPIYGNPSQDSDRNGTGYYAYNTIIDRFEFGIRILGDGNGSTVSDRKTNLVDVLIDGFHLSGNGATVNTAPWSTNVGIIANSAKGYKITNGSIVNCYTAGIDHSSNTGGSFTTPDEIYIDNVHIYKIGINGIAIDEIIDSKIENCIIHDTNETGLTPNGCIKLTDTNDIDVKDCTFGKSGDSTRHGILMAGTSAGNRAISNNVRSASAGAYNYTAGELTVYGDNRADILNEADGWTKVTNVLNMGTQTEVTISAGSITLTRTNHNVDTEANAAADDLTDIVFPNAQIGDRITLQPNTGSRTVNVRHAVGTAGTQTRTRSGATEALTPAPTDFQYDGNAWWKLN